MGARNLSREEYAMNHPAEWIGKSLIFKVRDVMKKKEELPICKEQDLIMDQLVELTSKGCGCLLVIDDGFHLLGTFPDGDLRRTLKASGEGIFKLTVGDMCNRFSTSLSRWRKQKRHSSGESWMLSFNYSFTNRKTEPEELQGQIYLAQ